MATFESDSGKSSDGLFSDKLLFFIFLFCMLSVLLQSLLILTSFSKLPPQIPLFYSKTWGEAMLAAPIYIWALPAMTLFIYFFNMLIAKFLIGQNTFLVRALFITSAATAIGTFLDTSKIISLVS